jgi:signal transduction histidine kinase
MAHRRLVLGPRLALLAAAALSLGWAITAILVVDPGADPPTTYAAALPAAQVADLAAGVGLVLAGGLALTQPQARRLGLLALLGGVTSLGADWEGWENGPPLMRSLGAVIAPFSLTLVLHLVLALPTGRLRSRSARALTLVAYGIAAAVSFGRALFRDPLLDLYCWRNCSDNTFLVHADPSIASTLNDIWLWSALAIALALLAVAAHRLVTTTRPARRVLLPLLGPAMLVGSSEAAYALALLRTPFEDPERTDFAAIFLVRSLGLAALALGLAWNVLRVPRTRARVARLASELGEAPPPGKLREALVAALGDPDVDVVYPRSDSDQLIDANGRRAALGAAAGRVVARITRGDRTRALVVHDPALVDEPELERALGSTARLAVENEALRAEALAQLEDLKASRARIVEAGDATRRRLERNLHDGAQQRLLALSYDLRLAHAEARADHDEALAAVLDAAGGETATALDELRELAQGIHPAILSEAGLGPALQTLADEAPVPVELEDVAPERLPPAIETTAYVTVSETIDDANRRGATFLAVRVDRKNGRLIITAEDDGAPRSSRLTQLVDRVGALGGSLDVAANTLRVEMPCE